MASFSTIKSSTEISEIFSNGNRFFNRYAMIIVEDDDHRDLNSNAIEHGRQGRVAFIAGKRAGNAVWRNSAKRRMREICRCDSIELEGLNVLFVAKSNIMKDSYSKVLEACEKTFAKVVKERQKPTDI